MVLQFLVTDHLSLITAVQQLTLPGNGASIPANSTIAGMQSK
jgi:hypothetical protein